MLLSSAHTEKQKQNLRNLKPWRLETSWQHAGLHICVTQLHMGTCAQASLTTQGSDISRSMYKPPLFLTGLLPTSKHRFNRSGCSLCLWQETTSRDQSGLEGQLSLFSAGSWRLSRRSIQRSPSLRALPLSMCLSGQAVHTPKPWWKRCRSWWEHCHRGSPSQCGLSWHGLPGPTSAGF